MRAVRVEVREFVRQEKLREREERRRQRHPRLPALSGQRSPPVIRRARHHAVGERGRAATKGAAGAIHLRRHGEAQRAPCRRRPYRDPRTGRVRNGRCDLHGGKSTGPSTPEGRARISAAQTARWTDWRRRQKLGTSQPVRPFPRKATTCCLELRIGAAAPPIVATPTAGVGFSHSLRDTIVDPD